MALIITGPLPTKPQSQLHISYERSAKHGASSNSHRRDFYRTSGRAGHGHQGVSFFTELNFFQLFGVNPVPWDANNETMPFFSHKTDFYVRARGIFFSKNIPLARGIKF